MIRIYTGHCSETAKVLDGSKYGVLLIITDGVIDDMPKTIKAVIQVGRFEIQFNANYLCGSIKMSNTVDCLKIRTHSQFWDWIMIGRTFKIPFENKKDVMFWKSLYLFAWTRKWIYCTCKDSTFKSDESDAYLFEKLLHRFKQADKYLRETINFTIHNYFQASRLPLSIIIVGVGKENFKGLFAYINLPQFWKNS